MKVAIASYKILFLEEVVIIYCNFWNRKRKFSNTTCFSNLIIKIGTTNSGK